MIYTYDCRKTFPRTYEDCHTFLSTPEKLNVLTADNRLSESLLDGEKLMFRRPTWEHPELRGVLMNWLGFSIDCENDAENFLLNQSSSEERYWVRFSLTRFNNKITYDDHLSSCEREFTFAGYDVVSWDGFSGAWDMGKIYLDIDQENAWFFTLNAFGLFPDLNEAEEFAKMMNEQAPEHSPFIVVKLEVSRV